MDRFSILRRRELTSKELITGLLAGSTLPRLPFIPFVYTHTAYLEQVSVRSLLTTPSLLARGLLNAQKLYGYDAITFGIDATLEAEACGSYVEWERDYGLPCICSPPPCEASKIPLSQVDLGSIETRGRVPVVMEAMKVVKASVGQNLALVSVLTDPVTLAVNLYSEKVILQLDQGVEKAKTLLDLAGQALMRICRAYCELRPDIVIINADLFHRVPLQLETKASSILRSISALTDFYDIALFLLLSSRSGVRLKEILELGIDGIVVAGDIGASWLRTADESRSMVLGVAVSTPLLLGNDEKKIHEFVRMYEEEGGSRRLFFSTGEEVPYGMPPEGMHTTVKAIKELGFGSI